MLNMKFIAKTIAIFSLTTALCASTAAAIPPQIQNKLMVGTLAGNGSHAATEATGLRLSTPLDYVYYLGLRPDGNLLLPDYNLGDIKLLQNTRTGSVLDFSGIPGTPGVPDGTLTGAQYSNLYGIAYDTFGYAWVADFGNSAVRWIDEGGNSVVRVFDGINPRDLVSDQSGDMYVGTDNGLLKLTYSGATPTILNTSSIAITNFGSVSSLAFNPAYDTLYFIDQANANINAYDVIADSVSSVYSYDSSLSQFNGIVVDSSGNIYVSDGMQNVIWQFNSSFDPPSLYAGVSGTGGYVDGSAISALFRNPYGMAIDGNDNIYIADANNFRVREIITVPDFSQFITAGVNPALATALNNAVTQIVLSGDITSTAGVFDNPLLAALQGLQLLNSVDQLQFLQGVTPVHYPGMLVSIEFANNKIFNIQSMRSHSLHRKCAKESNAPASSNGGASASYKNAPGGVWFEPILGYLNRTASAINPNLQNHIDGITGGLDYSFYEDSFLGVSFGKMLHRVHYDYRTQKEMIDSYFVSPYASAALFGDKAIIELAGLYSRNLNKVDSLTYDGTPFSGKDSGNTWAGRVFASYKLFEDKWIDISPYAEVEYTNLQNGKYTQTPVTNMNFGARRHNSAMLRDEAGLIANLRMGYKCSPLTLHTKVGYVRKDQIQGGKIVIQNSQLPDFKAKMKEKSHNLVAAGAQLEYEVAPNASISATYEGEFGDGYYGQSYSASVGAKIRF